MVVPVGFAIVAAGAVAKTDFVHEPGIFQVAQRVVNCCVADAGESPARSLEDIAGGGVVISFLDNLKNRLPLWRQPGLRLIFLLCVSHNGFRLILNRRIVKRTEPSTDYTDFQVLICGICGWFFAKVDDLVDIAFERWAVNTVRCEELLRLGSIVKLLYEEVRNRMMRQV